MSQHNNLMSENIDIIAPALRKAKSTFQPIIKNRTATNTKFSYKYADFADCITAIEQALNENGLSFSQSVETEEAGKVLVTLLLHDSGQWLKSKFPLESVAIGQGNAMQQIGAGVTYAKRYALCGILGVATEDDDAQALNKARQKEEAKERIINSIDRVKEFMNMCKEAELNVKEFAKFAGVDSAKPATVDSGIENFNFLKQTYLELTREHEAA